MRRTKSARTAPVDRVVDRDLWRADVSVAAAGERAPARMAAGVDIVGLQAHGGDFFYLDADSWNN